VVPEPEMNLISICEKTQKTHSASFQPYCLSPRCNIRLALPPRIFSRAASGIFASKIFCRLALPFWSGRPVPKSNRSLPHSSINLATALKPWMQEVSRCTVGNRRINQTAACNSWK